MFKGKKMGGEKKYRYHKQKEIYNYKSKLLPEKKKKK